MTKRIQGLESGAQSSGEAQDSALADLADSLRAAFEKNGTAIEMGAQLRALSLATGETAAKLYEFQRGLEAVGGKNASMPSIFTHTRNALADAGVKGSDAAEAFAQLGLKSDFLHGKDMTDVVLRIADALGKLKPDQAVEIARQLFGAGGAESVLQIGRNMDLFQGQMSNASNTGRLLETFSRTFQEMNAGRNDLKGDVLSIQAAMAGKNASDIQKIFSIIHDDIKNIGPAIAGAAQSPTDVIHNALAKLTADLNPFAAIMSKGVRDNGGTVVDHSSPAHPGFDWEKLRYGHDFTSLEKMGFIMSGSRVQNPMDLRKVDLLRQIANNTARNDHSTSTSISGGNAL